MEDSKRTGDRAQGLLNAEALALDVGELEDGDAAGNAGHDARAGLAHDDDGVVGLVARLVNEFEDGGEEVNMRDNGCRGVLLEDRVEESCRREGDGWDGV